MPMQICNAMQIAARLFCLKNNDKNKSLYMFSAEKFLSKYFSSAVDWIHKQKTEDTDGWQLISNIK
jgi:hypothetical protein